MTKSEINAIDFCALLNLAKAKHKQMKDKVAECEMFESRLTEMHNAQNDYADWIKFNITENGIHMTVDHATGEPRGLFVFVAGTEC